MVAVMVAVTDGDVRSDADIADMDAGADFSRGGGCSQKDQRENRSGDSFHGIFPWRKKRPRPGWPAGV